jgi:hypothetical protein
MSTLVVGDHLLKGHLAPGVLAHSFHVRERDAVGLPLRNRRLGDADVIGERSAAANLGLEPVIDVHGLSLGSPRRVCQAFSRPIGFSINFTVKEYRRARFKELLDSRFKGDRAALIRETGFTKGRVSQLLDPDEPFGDNAAASLVERLHLPAGYFDPPTTRDTSRPVSRDAMEVALAYDKMSPAERMRLDRLMAAAMDMPETAEPAREHAGGMSGLTPLEEPKKKKG